MIVEKHEFHFSMLNFFALLIVGSIFIVAFNLLPDFSNQEGMAVLQTTNPVPTIPFVLLVFSAMFAITLALVFKKIIKK